MFSQKFWKSHRNVLYSYVHLHSLIKRMNIYINMYSFSSNYCLIHLCHLSYIYIIYIIYIYICIHRDFTTFSWKSIGQHVYEPWIYDINIYVKKKFPKMSTSRLFFRVCGFEKPQTSPNSLSPSTTVLSPYVTFGCLSARTFWWRLTEVHQGVSGTVHHKYAPPGKRRRSLWFIMEL